MKKILLAIPIIAILITVVVLQFDNSKEPLSAEVSMSDNERIDSVSAMIDSVSTNLDETMDSFALLKPLVEETVAKIKEYERQRDEYESQVSAYVMLDQLSDYDTKEIEVLKKKLADANKEIGRLNRELASVQSRGRANTAKRKSDSIQAAIITPDDNALIIELDGGGMISPDNLTIYLLPYSRKVKKHMAYEASCSLGLAGSKAANYLNGLYFFNDVKPGKYLIKICTYYGNYKVLKKEPGIQEIVMQIAPPLQ